MKQGMKPDQASSLVEITAAKCSTVKYDVELAEEYIARQVIFTMLADVQYALLSKKKIFYEIFFFFLSFNQLVFVVADFHLFNYRPKFDRSSSSLTFSTSHLYIGCSHF